ncbi:MAG TPA: glycosyltransferase family 4 protein [Solirubrobacterales bacterium]|nr:glycosyltransferase family 4 protein [Solirubrobacterales bacterium]
MNWLRKLLRRDPGSRLGVNVIGFHRSDFGIAEAGRRVIEALESASVPVRAFHDTTYGRVQTGHPEYPSLPIEQVADRAAFPVNLLCLNGNHILGLVEEIGAGLFEARHTIALWFWESDLFPDEWMPALEYVDELWAPSRYVAECLAAGPAPVTRVVIPMTPPQGPPLDRASYGIGRDDYLFLCMLDYGSAAERKNPIGTVDAFRAAFEPGAGAALLLKTSLAEYGGDLPGRVRAAAAGHPDVHILDASLPTEEKDALLAGCDCYVSLHRSEGFGLGAAEAMCLGKPVIATGYAGTLDFMTAGNGYLVSYTLVEVGPGHPPYAPQAHWAEPDLGHAARLMREVFDDRAGAAERGRQAAADMRSRHSPRAAGEIMKRRLEEIAGAARPG